jgi:hypothetical protein
MTFVTFYITKQYNTAIDNVPSSEKKMLATPVLPDELLHRPGIQSEE